MRASITILLLLISTGCRFSPPVPIPAVDEAVESVESIPDLDGLGPIRRIREIKKWKREQKLKAIENAASQGRDLESEIKARYIDALIPNEIF